MSINNNASTDTTILDDISRGIEKVTITDNTVDVSRYDTSDTKSEEMNNKKCTSCEQKLEHIKTNEIGADNASGDDIDKVLRSVDIVSNVEEVQTCANCGKEGANNTCNKCKMVKYCNASCKKRHRSKHKKDCEEHLKRVAELHDEKLFKLPPLLEEECPICLVRLPNLTSGSRFQSCCGKDICSGCINAMDNKMCPFCRAPTPHTDDEIIERAQKRVELNDAEAITIFGFYYSEGICGLPLDYTKALELWHRAAELGHSKAFHNIGNSYYFGHGVERDVEKALPFYESAAMGGCVGSRHNLGITEFNNIGNTERALRQFMLAVVGGYHKSLQAIKNLYSNGYATKEDYAKALRAYQKYLDEIRSPQRDEAATAREDYQYIE